MNIDQLIHAHSFRECVCPREGATPVSPMLSIRVPPPSLSFSEATRYRCALEPAGFRKLPVAQRFLDH